MLNEEPGGPDPEIIKILTPLLLHKDIPLETVAVLASIIEMDARFRSFECKGFPKREAPEEMLAALEMHYEISTKSKAMEAEFRRVGDADALMRHALEIKNDFDTLAQGRSGTQ